MGRRILFIFIAAAVGFLVYTATGSSDLSYIARSIARTVGY